MQVLAFTGMPGAGKSEAVEEARRRKIPIVVMGDFVRAAVKENGLAPTDENVGRIATRFRAEKGADWWARQTADEILEHHARAPLVVIDGVRTIAEVRHLRQRLGHTFHLVAIEAPLEVRAKRLHARGRPDDTHDAELVKKRDERERAWGIDQAIAAADTRIVNHGALNEFRGRIRALFDQLTQAA